MNHELLRFMIKEVLLETNVSMNTLAKLISDLRDDQSFEINQTNEINRDSIHALGNSLNKKLTVKRTFPQGPQGAPSCQVSLRKNKNQANTRPVGHRPSTGLSDLHAFDPTFDYIKHNKNRIRLNRIIKNKNFHPQTPKKHKKKREKPRVEKQGLDPHTLALAKLIAEPYQPNVDEPKHKRVSNMLKRLKRDEPIIINSADFKQDVLHNLRTNIINVAKTLNLVVRTKTVSQTELQIELVG